MEEATKESETTALDTAVIGNDNVAAAAPVTSATKPTLFVSTEDSPRKSTSINTGSTSTSATPTASSSATATELITQMQTDIKDLLVTGQVSTELFKDIVVEEDDGRTDGLPVSAMVGATLINENAFLQQEAQERNKLIEELKSKVDLLSTILTENVAKTTSMENDLLVQQEEICSLEEKEALLKRENAKLSRIVEEQSLALKRAEEERIQLRSAETTISGLQDELVAALENLVQSREELKSLADVDTLRVAELAAYSKEIEDLKGNLALSTENLTLAKQQVEEMKCNCDESLVEYEARFKELSSATELYKLESATAKENLAKARGAHERWEEERKELIASMESWKRMSAGGNASQRTPTNTLRRQSSNAMTISGSGLPVRSRGSTSNTPIASPRTTALSNRGTSSATNVDDDGVGVGENRRYLSIEADYSMLSGLAPTSLRPSELLMDSARRTYLAVAEIIESGDVERMKAELISLSHHLEEMRTSNARLLGKLQAARGNIQVCCRTRPPSVSELAALQGATNSKICVDVVDDNELAVYDYRSEVWRSFNFDRVWKLDATQSEVFADIEPLVMSVVDGYNCCLLAYGQTGSGKTFTMNGYGDEYGISYRTLNRLFEALETKRDNARAQAIQVRSRALAMQHSKTKVTAADGDELRPHLAEEERAVAELQLDTFTYKVEVSILEIYNDHVRDLLVNPGPDGFAPSLEIRQTPEGSVFVPGLLQVRVFSLEDVMTVFARGSSNRATAATNLNERSSRSHLILQVSVTTTTNDESSVKAKLSLVDLAGSERVSKSGSVGSTMKEAQHINKSLSALGDVMEALDQKLKHVPYRNSKLTYLLNDSLGGNSRTMMLVTLCPTHLTSEETLFSLQFATRVRNVSLGAARKNVSAKNLEDALKAVKMDLRESMSRRASLEEAVVNLKRELRIRTEKSQSHVLLDTKIKTIDEAKRFAESQLQQLERQNRDLMFRLQEERTEKSQSSLELSAARRDLQKLRDRLKEVTNEKENLSRDLRNRDHELAHLKLRRYSGAGVVVESSLRTSSPERELGFGYQSLSTMSASGSFLEKTASPSPKGRSRSFLADDDFGGFKLPASSTDHHQRGPNNSEATNRPDTPTGSVNSSSMSVAELIEHYEHISATGNSAPVPGANATDTSDQVVTQVSTGAASVVAQKVNQTSSESSSVVPTLPLEGIVPGNPETNNQQAEVLNISSKDGQASSTKSRPESLSLESYTHPTLQASSPSSPSASYPLVTPNSNNRTPGSAYSYNHGSFSSYQEGMKQSDIDDRDEVARYTAIGEQYSSYMSQSKPFSQSKTPSRADYSYASPDAAGSYPLGYEPPRTRPASTTSGLSAGVSPASAHYRPKMTPRSKEALLKHQERLALAKKRASL